MSAMRDGMHCITDMELDIWYYDWGPRPAAIGGKRQNFRSGLLEGLTAMLARLGPACPALQRLQVDGAVERELLASFGVCCKQLSRLVVRNANHSKAFEQLHLILPCLTHCTLIPTGDTDKQEEREMDCCLAILTCERLVKLNVQSSKLSNESVLALPPCLKELECAMAYNPPTDPLHHMAALRRLTLHMDSHKNNVRLSTLARILHAAPGLHRLKLCGKSQLDLCEEGPGILVLCQPASIADLQLLSERTAAGLILSVEETTSGESITLKLMLNEFQPGFLDNLPPLSVFTSVQLIGSATKPTFDDMMQGIATAFPNLCILAVVGVRRFYDPQLSRLADCTSLRSLVLKSVDISPAGLTILCSRLPGLDSLTMEKCRRCEHNLFSMERILQAWGLYVDVGLD